jgi:aryl-alcohol dehydrogenase-like predicted oxidoreductase
VNLDVEALDLLQLHCPPTEVYYNPEVFEVLDDLTKAGKIKHYGVSVEKVEEAIKAIEFPNVKSVQIIFNIFRRRPAEQFFQLAQERQAAVLARVPLASGLLSGKMTRQTTFSEDDHRTYNRYGQAFDVGETFSGVDYESGLEAADEIRSLVPEGMSMAQFALRWILMFEAVSTAIPGAKNAQQATDNAKASEFPPLYDETMVDLQGIYEKYIQAQVHQRW